MLKLSIKIIISFSFARLHCEFGFAKEENSQCIFYISKYSILNLVLYTPYLFSIACQVSKTKLESAVSCVFILLYLLYIFKSFHLTKIKQYNKELLKLNAILILFL